MWPRAHRDPHGTPALALVGDTVQVLVEDLTLVLVEAVLVWPSLLLPPSELAPLCLLPSEC